MTRLKAILALLAAAGVLAFVPAEPTRRQRLADLSAEDRAWVTEYVAPIILPEEDKLFLELTADYQRDIFKKEFWARRERDGLPAPFGPGYERRYQHLREVAAADYDGLFSDAGRMVVRLGEPRSIQELLLCSEVYRQAEIWTYSNSTGSSSTETRHLFYRSAFGAPRKLWIPGDTGIFQTASCLTSFEQACAYDPRTAGPPKAKEEFCYSDRVPQTCPDACRVAGIAEQIRGRGVSEGSLIQRAPAISTEGLDVLRSRFAALSDPNAKPLSVTGPSGTAPVPTPPASPLPTPKPSPAVKTSKKEQLAALSEDERAWLTEYVAPIIFPEEEKLFLQLTQPYERERFQREFWARRERESLPPPLGPGYEVRYRELRRLVDEVYDGWREDAGRMVLRYGEPAELHKITYCDQVFRELEVWTYANTPVSSGRAHFLLYRFQPLVPRKLWGLGTPDRDIFLPNSCRQKFADLYVDCPEAPISLKLADKCKGPVCPEACDVFHLFQEISGRQHSTTGASQERAKLLAPPAIALEGIDRIRDLSASAADPNAKPLTVTGPSGTAPVRVVKASKQELLEALPTEEREWLTEFVEPIILPEEEKLFLDLSRPEHFAHFKEEFWKRRERDGLPFPMGPGYRGRYEELWRRAAEAYDGRQYDAGRMVLRHGEPASINSLEGCKLEFRDLEIWTYRNPAQGSGTHHFFYRKYPGAPRKLWTVGTPDGDVFSPGACRKSFQALVNACVQSNKNDPCLLMDCAEMCGVYQTWNEIRTRQGSQLGAEVEWGRLLASAVVSTEGLESLRTRMLGAPFANAPAPPDPLPRAARKTKKELLAELPDDERAWLTEYVAPIIRPEEEKLFLELTAGYQWEIFKREFWARRERDGLPRPFGVGFERRYEELRPRLDSVYDGWRNDAGSMVLHYGEPNEIQHVQGCDLVFRDLEIWTYENLGEARQKIHHLFYRPSPLVPRKLWRMVLKQDPSFDEVFVPKYPPWTFEALRRSCVGDPVCNDACDVYRVYREVVARQGSATGGLVESARVFGLPEISTEGLDQLRSRFPTSAIPNAKAITVQSPSSSGRRPEPTPTPEPRRWLSTEEMRERIVRLELKYRQFLELAGPLLTLQDLSLFLQMSSSEKDKYIRAFWKRKA